MIDELLARYEDGATVAFGAAGTRTIEDLRRDLGIIAAALPEPEDERSILLVFERDRYLFVSALLGAIARGHSVLLPPNARRESIGDLLCDARVLGLLHDTGAGLDLNVDQLLEEPSSRPLFTPREAPETIATLFTSGTTSAFTEWPKTKAQLLGEAKMLGEHFGITASDRVLGLVSPLHIYGLLYTVLMPLLQGAAFSRETPLYAESIALRLRVDRPSVMIAVPAQLRAFSAIEARDFESVRRVFSSTAPLREEAAAQFLERTGLPITEVFGSTETGGIASRERTAGSKLRALPGVGVSIDEAGYLLVDSPFADERFGRPYRTGDLAEIDDDGALIHRGRADGIVKIGGRRLALPELEERVRSVQGIEDAAVVALKSRDGRGHHLLLAYSPERVKVERVRQHLMGYYEPSCIPRRIVSVDRLPREDNGKLTRAALLSLFDYTAEGRPLRRELEWQSDIKLRVPETYLYYDGHFPGYPILPGAAQLLEIVAEGMLRRGETRTIQRFSRLKFLGRILPGDELEFELRVAGDEAYDFFIRTPRELASSGRVHLREGLS